MASTSSLEADVRKNGIYSSLRDLASVGDYMSDRNQALGLVAACLDFPSTPDNNPLVFLINEDERDNKHKSVAYLYAFRRLMTMPKTQANEESIQALIDTVALPVGVILRVLLLDAPRIDAVLPKGRTFDDYQKIRKDSMYVYALMLLNPKFAGSIQQFSEYQIMFPVSPQMLVAGYVPLIDDEEYGVWIAHIGDFSKYPNEIIWIMIQTMAAQLQSEDPGDVEMIMEALDINTDDLGYLNPTDVLPAREALVTGAVALGIDATQVEPPNPVNDGPNIPATEEIRQSILSLIQKYGPIDSLTKEVAQSFVNDLRELQQQYQQGQKRGANGQAFRRLGDLISTMYDIPVPQSQYRQWRERSQQPSSLF